jgi:hypothetical protein
VGSPATVGIQYIGHEPCSRGAPESRINSYSGEPVEAPAGKIAGGHAEGQLSEESDADEASIRTVLSGNLCRRTGYIPIIEAELEARAAYRKADKS